MKTTDKRKANAEKRAVWLRNYQRARGRAQTRNAPRPKQTDGDTKGEGDLEGEE